MNEVYDIVQILGVNTKIYIYQRDITELKLDGIVNAANCRLKHLAVVAQAKALKAGPKLQGDCDDLINQKGLIPIGECRLTQAYNLGARGILHTVGPDGNVVSNPKQFEKLLKKAYKSCLSAANKIKMETIAIPLISSGLLFSHLKLESESVLIQQVLIFLYEGSWGGGSKIIEC